MLTSSPSLDLRAGVQGGAPSVFPEGVVPCQAAVVPTSPNRGPMNGQRPEGSSRVTQQPEDLFTNDVVNVRLCPEADPTAPPPEPEPQETAPGSSYANSRCNALRAALRARLVFPGPMKVLIDQRASEFAVEWHAAGPLELWLCAQMGIASVQVDTADDQLLFDTKRVIDVIPTCWDDRKSTIADTMMTKLPRDPFTVARALGTFQAWRTDTYLSPQWTGRGGPRQWPARPRANGAPVQPARCAPSAPERLQPRPRRDGCAGPWRP